MTLEATRDILGDPVRDHDYIAALATNLGWAVMDLDGVSKPDMLLMRGRVIPVFIRSKTMNTPRRKAMSRFALAGSPAMYWGRADGDAILEELAR